MHSETSVYISCLHKASSIYMVPGLDQCQHNASLNITLFILCFICLCSIWRTGVVDNHCNCCGCCSEHAAVPCCAYCDHLCLLSPKGKWYQRPCLPHAIAEKVKNTKYLFLPPSIPPSIPLSLPLSLSLSLSLSPSLSLPLSPPLSPSLSPLSISLPPSLLLSHSLSLSISLSLSLSPSLRFLSHSLAQSFFTSHLSLSLSEPAVLVAGLMRELVDLCHQQCNQELTNQP